jgi:hypothetical protein
MVLATHYAVPVASSAALAGGVVLYHQLQWQLVFLGLLIVLFSWTGLTGTWPGCAMKSPNWRVLDIALTGRGNIL